MTRALMAVSPLPGDLRSQADLLRSFVIKTLLLIILFLGLDRVGGWVLRIGLDRYYGLDVPAQVLCVGHSHTVLGIDKVALEQALGVPVAKFAVEGANSADRQVMIQYYFKRQTNSVRAVVYDVDAHAFTGAGLSSSSYQLLFPFIDDPEVRDYIRRNCSSRSEYLLRRAFCTTRYDELTLSLAARGFLRKWTSFKSGQVDVGTLRRQVQEGRFREISFDRENINVFSNTVRFVTRRDITLLLAYIPTIDAFNQAEPAKYRRSLEILAGFAPADSGVVFLNYNPEFETRHELFRDPIHLNRDGQREITARLARDLKEVLCEPKLARNGSDHGHAY